MDLIIEEQKLREFPIKTDERSKYMGEFNLITASRYGAEGLIPCHKGYGQRCISSNGKELCKNYWGHEEVSCHLGKLYIVQCASKEMKCHPKS